MLGNYWRTVAAVLTGTAAAQAIPVLGSLIIARLYAPQEFGIFSAWLGMVLLAAVMLTARFEMALALTPDGSPREQAMLATLITILLAALPLTAVVGLVFLLSPQWTQGINTTLFITFVPCAILLATAQTWQAWAAAEGKFRALSIMRISQAAGITALQIIAGTLLATADTLAIAQLCGILAGLFVAIRAMPVALRQNQPILLLLTQFWQRYRRFPTLSLPADAINTAAAQLPLLIVASRFGTEIAGLLALTMRVIGAPIGILGRAVLDVFKRHAAVNYRENGECRSDYLRTFKVLSITAVTTSFVLLVISEQVFALFFGEAWRLAGTVAIWLLPMFALRFVASPLSYLFYLAEQQHLDLIWQLTLLVMTVASLLLPSHYRTALIAYSYGYSLLYIIYLTITYQLSLGQKS